MTDEPAAFQQLCRSRKWKCTPQRLAVYCFVSGNLSHPSVDEVWAEVRKRVPAITRESVYRILNELAEAGVLYRMDKIESAHYDARMTPHGHLVCEKCGGVTDFELTAPPTLPESIPQEEIRHVELRISWLCPKCRHEKDAGWTCFSSETNAEGSLL